MKTIDMLSICPLVLLIILMVIKRTHNEGIIVEDPDIPCGLREKDYKKFSTIKGKMFLNSNFLENNGPVRARPLDELESPENSLENNELNEEQLNKLSLILTKLYRISHLFKNETLKTYKKLIKRSKSLLGDNFIKKENLKEPLFRIYKSEEVDGLFNESSHLIGEIKKKIKIKTRIVGGVATSIKDVPWIVSIQHPFAGHVCGGAIVTPRFIVTAAHCAYGNEESKKIVALESNFIISVGSAYVRNGTRYNVLDVAIHPGFDHVNFSNDISVWQVEPIKFKKGHVVPICIPPKNLKIYGKATVAGWGKLRSGFRETSSDKLMRISIDLLNKKYCDVYSTFRDELMICAGVVKGGKDTCNGDSGGPLQAILPNNRAYLIGIVSYGEDECALPEHPGVFTKESHYVDWMYDAMNSMK